MTLFMDSENQSVDDKDIELFIDTEPHTNTTRSTTVVNTKTFQSGPKITWWWRRPDQTGYREPLLKKIWWKTGSENCDLVLNILSSIQCVKGLTVFLNLTDCVLWSCLCLVLLLWSLFLTAYIENFSSSSEIGNNFLWIHLSGPSTKNLSLFSEFMYISTQREIHSACMSKALSIAKG